MIFSRPSTRGTSPLALLPPEVLSLVFLSLHEPWKYDFILPFHTRLSHVCMYWRDVALSTPQLWSTITFFAYSARSQSCVNEWLIRSRKTLLHVRIIILWKQSVHAALGGNVPDPPTTPQWATLQLLASHIHHFRSLAITTSYEVTLYYILQLFKQAEAPLLQDLILQCASSGRLDQFKDYEGRFTLATAFDRGLPSLTFVQLQTLRCLPPFTNITDLQITRIPGERLTLRRLSDIILAPHCLISLSIHGCVDHRNGDLEPRRGTKLSELRNLELVQDHWMNCFYLIKVLWMPKLESVCLNGFVNIGGLNNQCHPIQETTSTHFSLPSVKYITLAKQYLSSKYLSAYMQVFPSPTHILFINPQFQYPGSFSRYPRNPPNSWKEFFSVQDSEMHGSVWPNVEVVAFEQVNFNQVTPGGSFSGEPDFIRFIEARPPWKIVGDSKLLSHIESLEGPISLSQIELYEPWNHGIIDYRCSRCRGQKHGDCVRYYDPIRLVRHP